MIFHFWFYVLRGLGMQEEEGNPTSKLDKLMEFYCWFAGCV